MFRVIIADPPWQFEDKLTMSEVARGASSNYPVLDIDAICALPVKEWALPDSLLALWVPSSLLADGLRCMSAWGFQQKQIYTWGKTTNDGEGLAFGMGRYFRGCTEHALIGTRGKIAPYVKSKSERNLLMHPKLPHSEKPEGLHQALMRMLPGPYLELFARRSVDYWTCIGNEAPGFKGVDIRDIDAHILFEQQMAQKFEENPPPGSV